MIAFGTAPARPATVPQQPQTKTVPETLRAGVSARDASGAPARIELPRPGAAARTPLYASRPGGGLIWVAEVMPAGNLQSDGLRAAELARITPGTRIDAVCDVSGRVIALVAKLGPPAAGKQRRAAAPSRTLARSADDPYAHDPAELLIAGGGSVQRVQR
jgi:hypothetical protein